MKIVTDSKLPGEPKDPESTSLTALYDAFAMHEEREEFRKKLKDGLGWGEAKEIVFEKINSEIGPMRERYEAYMREPEKVEAILREGVERIRPMARALVDQCRNAVGLRTFKPLQEKKVAAKTKKSKASLKQYREKDGLFYFKLVNGQGKTLLTAGGLPSGKEVGAHLQSFKASGLGALKDIFCQLDSEVTEAEVQSALDELTQE